MTITSFAAGTGSGAMYVTDIPYTTANFLPTNVNSFGTVNATGMVTHPYAVGCLSGQVNLRFFKRSATGGATSINGS